MTTEDFSHIVPAQQVDRDGKLVGAETPAGPHNWGRWGAFDERGTVNLVGPEEVQRGLRSVSTGEVHALGLAFGHGEPGPGNRPVPVHSFVGTGSDAVVGDIPVHGVRSSDDVVTMHLQASTHLDGLSHVGVDGTLYNGFWEGTVTSRRGARRLGIEHLRHGIVTRGVLLDVARHHNLDPFSGVITPDVLESVVAAQGTRIGHGDAVLLRTGWLAAWRQAEDPPRYRQPGLDSDCVAWAREHDISLVGADNRTIEAFPNEAGSTTLPFHIGAIRGLGLVLAELLDLESLAAACEADGRYDGLLMVAPMPLVGAVGSPVNPLFVR